MNFHTFLIAVLAGLAVANSTAQPPAPILLIEQPMQTDYSGDTLFL